MKIADYSVSRDNNFNLMRFIAAYLVLISHSYAIFYGGAEFEPLSHLNTTLGSVAVDIFFVISGFLILQSFENSSIFPFFLKRILRIYPALIVSVITMAIALSDDLSSYSTLKFLIKNTTLIFGVEYQLPNTFESTPLGNVVNGSLWTLPWEVRCYFVLALLASINRPIVIILSTVVFLTAYLFFDNEYLRLFSMFFLGSTFYILRNKIEINHFFAIFFLVVLLISTLHPLSFRSIYLVTIPYLVFYFAYTPKGFIRKFNSIGDYSYGIYIYAFPIQQAMTFVAPDILTHILGSASLTLLPAIVSWHLIEKQMIKSYLRNQIVDLIKRSS